jgi:exopolyphosphatase/guanosine-5'-triphosphate,3'-diphosphate pyrophosphatase
MYKRLTELTLKERENVLTLEKGREDLIIPGSAITFIVMESFGFSEIKVSDAGLLEGIILRAGNVASLG